MHACLNLSAACECKSPWRPEGIRSSGSVLVGCYIPIDMGAGN